MGCTQGNPEGNFLPSEILLDVISAVSVLPEDHQQETLASCCLVSRQWYSVAVEFLYRSPQITSKNFVKFAYSISPSRFSVKSHRSGGLGQYVHRFSMANLVHESSNSLTARLLGRMKENLEYFIAPQSSFSESSLVPISKTKTLQTLNLSYIKQPMELLRLKKSIQNLDRLKSLFLPASSICPFIAAKLDDIPWPPSLRRLRVYNINIPQEDARQYGSTMPAGAIAWPDTLTSLVYQPRCYQIWVLRGLLSDENLAKSLQRFKIVDESGRHQYSTHLSIGAPVTANIPFFSVPGHMFSPLIYSLHVFPPSAFGNLETLEFGNDSADPVDFPLGVFLGTLESALQKLRLLRVHLSCTDEKWDDDLEQKLEFALKANAIKAGYNKAKIESGEIPVGVEYFD